MIFNIPSGVPFKRYRRSQKSKMKRKAKRKRLQNQFLNLREALQGDKSYFNVLSSLLPKNLKYQLWCEESPIYILKLTANVLKSNGTFLVPSRFSLIDSPKESQEFIRNVVTALILQKFKAVIIDYKNCIYSGLETQVYFDAIIKDIITFYKRCKFHKNLRSVVQKITGDNVIHPDVRKLLFSVGSPAIHANVSIPFKDVVPYRLCVYNGLNRSPKSIKRKGKDTTSLVDYVVASLQRLNRKLTPEKLEDLCIVISETLINAEEHSSTKYRYSIGYFTEVIGSEHYGVFRLVIMNFGETIYEKFKDPDCPNKHSVTKMRELTKVYNYAKAFKPREFEEETLWTLYSLQEGITSTNPTEYTKRGNGSIQFINSFLTLKGQAKGGDTTSKMVIMSGNTQIIFDGKYQLVSGRKNGDEFQYITFNESGNIMNKPDPEFVKFVPNYFPGTIISAEILFNEDDFDYDNQ